MSRASLALLVAMLLPGCGSRTDLNAGSPGGGGQNPRSGDGGEDAHADAAEDASIDGQACSETVCGDSCVDVSSDPRNCGRCGHDCLGGACVSGRCQPVELASGHQFAFLAVTSTTLFAGWPDGIESIPLPTGTPVPVANAHVGGIVASAVDLFWVSDDGLWVARGGLASSITKLVPVDEPLGSYATGIAADASRVYWFGHAMYATSGTLHAVGFDGASPTALPAPSSEFLGSLAADGQAVYWGTWDSVGSTTVPAGPASELAPAATPGQGDVFDDGFVAIDDANIFVATMPQITSLPKAGGAVTSIAPTHDPVAIAVDDTYVYWADFTDQHTSSILRAPKAGGSPETLASSMLSTQHILVDAVSVIWANIGTTLSGSDGSVMRLAK
jgi:hypothetical protein